MAVTLAVTGSLVRSEATASFNLFQMTMTEAVNEEANGRVIIANNSTVAVEMSHLTTGEFLALKVITADKNVNVTVNGSNQTFSVNEICFSGGNVTSLSLGNADSAAIEVQYVLGGV